MNQFILTGRLTKDPELKQTESGKSICTFSIAVSNGKDKTEFFEIVSWEAVAESVCRYLGKGDYVLTTGRISIDTWRDKEGNTRKAHKYNTQIVEFSRNKDKPIPQSAQTPNFHEIDDEDIPF